jgi:peroxiredoxin
MQDDEFEPSTSRYLTEGAKAPSFEFADREGKLVSSRELLRDGPVVLTFYRGAWCDCCKSDLRDLARATPRLRELGASVLGIFNELAPEANARIEQTYALEFPLVNDVDGLAAQGFGIRRNVAEMARIEDEFGPELLALKEGQPWILPMQARFVVGPDGVIAKSEVLFNYRERSDAATLLPVLKKLT